MWQYHKFSQNILEKVYINEGCKGILKASIESETPIDKLVKYLELIAKSNFEGRDVQVVYETAVKLQRLITNNK